MKLKTFLLSFSAVLALAMATPRAQEPGSDAAADADVDTEETAIDEACVSASRTQDIEVLTDRHVYVRTYGGNHYLLTMAQTCTNLLRSYRSGEVRLQPYGQRVCPNDGSHVIYTWFDRDSVCAIEAIDPVDDRRQARSIAEDGPAAISVEETPLE